MAKYTVPIASVKPVKPITAETEMILHSGGSITIPELDPEITFVEVEADNMSEAIEIAKANFEGHPLNKE